MAFFVKRLNPGDDFRLALQSMITEHGIEAGVIISAVGSFTEARLRLAGADVVLDLPGPLEIVSATGTVGSGGMHIHLAVADSSGRTIGGHLMEGCIINTTAEIVITAVEGWIFNRTLDPATGYPEFDPRS